jgi:L-asparaginase
MTEPSSPTIAVIALGGTIAMNATAGQAGVMPALSADDLLSAVPGLGDLEIELEALTFRTLPSASLTFADLTALAALIEDLADKGVQGVVITQGTDTLEESAFFLDITVTTDIPVVVTGAMRNPTFAGADGAANVLAAIRVAADPTAKGHGCLVVMADEIHAARHVRKTHVALAAFSSPNTGPLGHLVEGRPRLLMIPGPRVIVPRTGNTAEPLVPLVTTSLGDDLPLLRPRRVDVDGLVVGAFGVGHVPAAVVDLLADYSRHVPVVLASRVGAGAIHRSSYGFAGSEKDLQDRGLIGAGYLDPYKARILLARLIGVGAGRKEIVATFDRFG